MLLKEIAHSRTGDKGNISVISVIAYKDEDYALIKEKVTEEKLKDYFKDSKIICKKDYNDLDRYIFILNNLE